MTNSLSDYFDALDRLKSNKAIRVAKGVRITNDSVALEAGRGKGSIKKSRQVFAELILAIDEASLAQSKAVNVDKEKLDKAKLTSDQYREQLDASLAREVSLLYEIYALKKQLASLTGSAVIPLRKPAPPPAKNEV